MRGSQTEHPVVAVRLIVVNEKEQILLLRRDNCENDNGEWCLPGGKLDYGDTPEHTVEKEMMEETGLLVSGIKFLFYQNSLPRGPGKMHCLNLYFFCRSSGQIRLNEENSEHAWTNPEKAFEYKPVFGAMDAIERWMRQE